MTDMRALINKFSDPISEATLADPSIPSDAPGRAFGSWGETMESSESSVKFHAGALLGRQLRHVLSNHPEFTFDESKGDHDTIFTVTGPTDHMEALKRIVEKLTNADKIVDEAENMNTHASRAPTDEENDEAFQAISELVKDGYTSGNDALSSGARYSWTMDGDPMISDDEFAQEYVSGLIADGYREGNNPRWSLAINVWGDRLEGELDEDLSFPDGEVFDAEIEEEAHIPFDDGIADTEVLGMDDFEGSDVGADFCYATPDGEHHFIDGECASCGQDESFAVDEQNFDGGSVDLDGMDSFDAAPRIPR